LQIQRGKKFIVVEKKSNINTRLTHYVKNILGKKQNEVVQDTGISKGKVNNIFNDSQEVGMKVIMKFFEAYPSLNSKWVFYEQGDPEIHANELNEPIAEYSDLYDFNRLVEKVQEIESDVRQLKEKMNELFDEIKNQ